MVRVLPWTPNEHQNSIWFVVTMRALSCSASHACLRMASYASTTEWQAQSLQKCLRRSLKQGYRNGRMNDRMCSCTVLSMLIALSVDLLYYGEKSDEPVPEFHTLWKIVQRMASC